MPASRYWSHCPARLPPGGTLSQRPLSWNGGSRGSAAEGSGERGCRRVGGHDLWRTRGTRMPRGRFTVMCVNHGDAMADGQGPE